MSAQEFKTVEEHRATTFNGFGILLVGLIFGAFGVWSFVQALQFQSIGSLFWAVGLIVFAVVLLVGLFTVQPNESRVLIFFGRYIGSCRSEGFRWGNPFAIKRRVSLRVRNLTSDTIKVNDESGSPIEIAAVVVWRVVDSAKALFDVDQYEEFVSIQVETAVRSLATGHPYDPRDASGDEVSLRGNQEEIASELRVELQARLLVAGRRSTRGETDSLGLCT